MATFKTRARALDMLGRQQIAGIPTAISELFKNAHDAYADNVEVDYYRPLHLFVLRDDGVGMTQKDFESRWLTLGTESKVGSSTGLKPPPLHPDKAPRPIMGEKGIGRLAIGIIGPQVLLLSRALREGKAQDLVAAFLNWKIFEVPGIDLDQITIPVRTFANGAIPSLADVTDMVSEFGASLDSLTDFIEPKTFAHIRDDLKSFEVDPRQIDSWVEHLSLAENGCGTHFYIHPAYDTISADIDGKADDDIASPLIKTLIGFTNTMTPGHEPPRIKASFRDHKAPGNYDDLIQESEFFTPRDFGTSDHHIEGRFDEFGQFVGSVKVYDRESVDHVIPWGSGGKPTDCGPFKINFCYVQGLQKESTLPQEIWSRMSNKLNRIGGLYIYRDGIRVLPYGGYDYDFLNIERSRSKKADYWFFSYRRMFGVIEISQEFNSNLNEKAGREGFRENKAYRQFRDILQSFFVQLAADFFRKDGIYTDAFESRKEELTRIEEARRRREKLVSEKKRAFRKQLDDVFDRIAAGKPEEDVSSLMAIVERDLNSASQLADVVQAGNLFIEVESTSRRQLENIRNSYRVTRPRSTGLSRDLTRDWDGYLKELGRIEKEVFLPAARRIDETVGELAAQAKLTIDRRRRIERALSDLRADIQKRTRTESRETENTINEVKEQVVRLARNSLSEVDETAKAVFARFNRTDISAMDETSVVAERTRLEDDLLSVAERNKDVLENVREQLRAINLTPDEKGRLIGTTDMTEDLEGRLLALQESAEDDLELTQLGMAVAVINHEFESTVKAVRQNLRQLKAWADLNEGLDILYKNIRASFDHLDGYLSLFTPLQRRLYRNQIEISGADIGKFLQDLFEERLRRHDITLKQSSGFRSKKLLGYPSTFYPVFVNLVDNALYWLRDQPEPREVLLGADGDDFIICDNGPGVPLRDSEAIFEFGFSRKPTGRGMGLHIASRTLHEAGYRLTLDSNTVKGACFRISPIPDEADLELR